MTLTNHLLESVLKYALIINTSDQNNKEKETQGPIELLVETHSDGRNKYESSNLYQNINSAFSNGLISEEVQNQLHIFREQFRNAYGHADKKKTFGETATPMQSMHIDNNGIQLKENRMTKLVEMIVGQGIFQFENAKQNALPYFKYIDDVTSKMRVKLFGPIEENAV